MSFEIKTKPQRTIDGSAVLCNWNALFNPIIFEFERKDFLISSISDNGGNVEVTTLTPYGLTDVLAGDEITLFDNVYKQSAEVLSVISNTKFVLNLAFVSNASGYIILNKRKNYYLSSSIRWFNPETSSFETIATSINQADANNLIKLNASPFLKKKVSSIDSFDYVGLNDKRSNYSGKFSLIVTEYFDNTPAQVLNEAFVGSYFYVNSARQIQQKYGSNLAENFIIEVAPFTPAKMLSAFKKPTYFKNFPFALSFVLNETTAGVNLKQVSTFYDSNGVLLDSTNVALDFSQQNFLNSSNIQISGVDLTDVKTIKTELQNDLLVIDLTENFEVNFDSDCKQNPVFLNWLHTDGSRNFWLFERVQTKGIDVKLNSTFEKYEEDIEESEGSQFDIERSAKKFLTLGGFISIENIEALQSLLYSIDVLLLKNPETWQIDGVIWERVRITPGSFKLFETDQTSAEIELTIQLNETIIQTQ